jgi:hypothetical protein
MSPGNLTFPREVDLGINLINQGDYFQAHEVLELAWRNEEKNQRQLYQGLVQVSVLLYHLARGNTKGALKLLKKALLNLTPFVGAATTLDIPGLVSDLNDLRARIESGQHESVSSLTDRFTLRNRQLED